MARKNPVRVNLQVDEETHERALKMKEVIGAASSSAVVRRALETWYLIHQATMAGEKLIIREKDGHEREVYIL